MNIASGLSYLHSVGVIHGDVKGVGALPQLPVHNSHCL
jgi:serine/threonine protein kinase